MDSWRDQCVNFNHEVARTRSNNCRKPPIGGNSNWQQSVPSWEKKFCASIGSVPWKKLVETKKFIHLYDNIIKWNDSAGKEAFETEKKNFYANMYNLPHNSSFHDPDIYIDQINWDSEVDPNLILDLESDSVVPDSNSKDEQVVIFGPSFPTSYQNFSPYGWGDSDNEGGVVDNNDSWWGWNENNETRKGWDAYDDNNYFYGDVKTSSRYKTSRFRGRRNNGNGRKLGYCCAHVNSGSYGGNEYRWSVKKPVS